MGGKNWIISWLLTSFNCIFVWMKPWGETETTRNTALARTAEMLLDYDLGA